MALSTYFRIGSQLIVFVVLARVLGAEQFGMVAYWTAVTILVVLPVNYGFGMQLMREFSRAQDGFVKMLADTLSAKLFLSIVVLIFSFAFSFNYIHKPILFWFFLLSAQLDSYNEYLNYILRASGLYQVEARLSFVISAIQFVIVIAIATITKSAVHVAAGYLVSRSIGLFFTWRGVARVFAEFNYVWSKLGIKNIFKTLKTGFPYAADMAVSTMNSVLDTVLLKQYVSIASVGEYQAGARLMLGGATMASVINNVYLPKLSAHGCHDSTYKSTLIQLNVLMLACGGGMSLFFLLFNDFIATNLFGTGYKELSGLLPWFGFLLFLRYFAASFGVNLTALGHQKVRVYANVFYLISFVIAVAIIVPLSGLTGMLVSSCISTIFLIMLYFLYLFYRKLPIGLDYRAVVITLFILALYYFLFFLELI